MPRRPAASASAAANSSGCGPRVGHLHRSGHRARPGAQRPGRGHGRPRLEARPVQRAESGEARGILATRDQHPGRRPAGSGAAAVHDRARYPPGRWRHSWIAPTLAAMLARTRLTTLIVTAGLALIAAAPAGATTLPTGFAEADLSTGYLNSPTATAFAPDGRKFVTEKGGRVRVVAANGAVRSTPLLDLTAKVNSYSDRGMLGIATDKDFATNGYLYLLYVYELKPLMQDTDAPMVSRLTRVTVNPDNTLVNPSNPETVILGKDVSGPCPTPDNLRDCIPADYKWHTIGTVQLGPGRRHAVGRQRRHPPARRRQHLLPPLRRADPGRQDHPHRPRRARRSRATPSAPPRPTSPRPAPRSTPRASATRSASTCGPARDRSWATWVRTTARRST